MDRRQGGIVKLRPTAVLDAQHGGFTAGSSPVSWGSIDELFVNLTIPLRELDFNGIYRLSPDGELELLYGDQSRPNGIALSPDETTLYVANSDENQKVWMAYDLSEDGVSNPRVFYDVNDQTSEGAADGMKVDTAGNLFATGPGGVWVFALDGTHLGTIMPDEVPANVAWGDDGRTLYMTARTGLYRIRLTTEGSIPGP